jgi:DNA mismatch endonuclease (patch repair protein)
MRATRRRDTRPELEVRRLLHAAGLRYRVDWPLPTNPRRRADIAFTRQKIIVFIDGCFWHRCPQHYVSPKANSDYWDAKTKTNVARDANSDTGLRAAGWLVLRFWEHEDAEAVAAQVEAFVKAPTESNEQVPS